MTVKFLFFVVIWCVVVVGIGLYTSRVKAEFAVVSTVVPELDRFRGKSFYFVGDSYLRAVYFSMLEMYGRPLSALDRFIPSYSGAYVEFDISKCGGYNIHDDRYCFINTGRHCNLPGQAGVDLRGCGVPHNRTATLPEHNIVAHFQFKTYLSTPEHDAMIHKDIVSGNWDYIILGSSCWGRNRYIKNTGYLYQVSTYYDTILEGFSPLSNVAFIYNQGYNNSTETQWRFLSRLPVKIVNTKPFVREGRRSGVPMGHGYEGNVTRLIVKKLLSHL